MGEQGFTKNPLNLSLYPSVYIILGIHFFSTPSDLFPSPSFPLYSLILIMDFNDQN